MKKIKLPLFLIVLIFLFTVNEASAVSRFSVAAGGNWNAVGTWSTVCGGVGGASVPVAGDIVTICGGTVTINAAAACASLTVSPTATLTYSGAFALTTTGNVTINGTYIFPTIGAAGKTLVMGAGTTLTLGGTINMTGSEGNITMGAGSFFLMNAGSNLIWQPQTNTAAGATLFTNTTETFAATSTLTLLTWYNFTVALPSVISGNFGNITYSNSAVWDQKGLFGGATQKLMGTLTITAGQWDFDDGTGASTQLITGPITTSGTGGIIFARGANRNLTLTTGAFTHNGSGLAAGLYQTYGTFNWTINGTFAVSTDFTGIQGPTSGALQAVSTTITTTGGGNFNVSGGLFDMNRGLLNGNVTLNISGGINITGAPGWFRLLDPDTQGNLSVNATSMTVSGGTDNFPFMVDGTVNTASYTITGNMTVSGASTSFYLMGGNFFVFPFIYDMDPRGALSLTVTGTLSQSAGDFRGIQNVVSANAGLYTMNLGGVNFTGGTFLANYACRSAAGTHTFTVTGAGNMTVSYSAATNLFALNRLASLGATPNACGLNFSVGGNLTISGAATGEFNSNNGSGTETDIITGNTSISNGNNFFNSVLTAGNGHTTTQTIGGTLTVSGGTTQMSSETGTLTSTVTGAVSITGGTLIVKESTGIATVNFNSTYTQTGGTFTLHNNAAANNNLVAVTVAGDFSLGAGATAGTINFDAGASTTANTLTLNGSNFTMGGTSRMTHASAGTGTVYGELYYNPTSGTVVYNKQTATVSTTQGIQQVKQFINAAKTVNATASTQPFQIASNATQANITTTALTVNGILNIGTRFISAQGPSLTNYYSGFNVSATGTLQTANVNGFYNGTNASATVEPQIFSGNVNFRMDWDLNATSTVEYNGIANQVVTGKFPNAGVLADVASGTTAQYKYGILNINNLGTLGTNFANLAASNVFVRTRMDLTRGEFRLTDAAGATGYTATVESGLTGAITSTATGYLKSEMNVAANTAKLQWNIGATTGAHIYPFGVYNAAVVQLPLTFNNSGASGNVTIATRRTTVTANTPLAAVSNVAAVAGMGALAAPCSGTDCADEAVIDRWWDISSSLNPSPGTTAIPAVSVTFTYQGVENTMTVPAYQTGTIAAQHWNGADWDPPVSTGSLGVTTGTSSVTATGLTLFSPYILSALASPLPIELLNFTANLNGNNVALIWATASEINNDFFTVEKSRDGQNFVKAFNVDGAGNSTATIEYVDIDRDPYIGTSYYRLKQTDFDGKSSYSNIVPVEYNPDSDPGISLFPNPSDEGTTTYLSLNQLEGQEVLVVLRDIAGRELFSKVMIIGSNSELIAIDQQGTLAKGSYIITATNANKIYNKKLIIK